MNPTTSNSLRFPRIPFTLVVVATGFLHSAPLVTDRPDATESSSSVAPGLAQLETGLQFAENADGGREESYLGSLGRIGIAPGWELRVGWEGYRDTPDTSGAGDAFVGFKYALAPERGPWPETALLAHTSVPLGDSDLTSDAFDPDARLAFSHTLGERWSLGYNLGFETATVEQADGGETRTSSAIYTAALGHAFTAALGGYLEFFGEEGLSADPSPKRVNGGFTYLLDDDRQLDTFVGAGLNAAAEDWFFGVGYSVRWPFGK